MCIRDRGAGVFSRTLIVSVALPLATRFPLMIATTVVVVVIALIRAFVLEPLPARPSAPSIQRTAPAHARR